jgi:DNA end-binding protein Ku
MSARSIWKGVLNFSLVSVPVKLYKATDEKGKETSCRTLHAACNHPINEKTICTHCNTDVAAGDTVKGVVGPDGAFIVLTKDEIDGIKAQSSDTLAIETFVPLAEASDPLWVENSYYLTPDGKAATKAFATLRAGLLETQTAGQARITINGREQSALVVPNANGLTVRLMRSKSLVRDASELPAAFEPSAVTVDPAEAALLKQIIGTLSAPFDKNDYEDGYVKAFKALVESKTTGVPVAATTTATVQAAGADLMAALKASLNSAKLPTKAAALTVEPKGKSSRKAKAS